MSDECQDCRYAMEVGINPGQLRKNFECRRYPPTALLVASPQGPMPISVHPPTQATHSCGEFAPQLLKLAS